MSESYTVTGSCVSLDTILTRDIIREGGSLPSYKKLRSQKNIKAVVYVMMLIAVIIGVFASGMLTLLWFDDMTIMSVVAAIGAVAVFAVIVLIIGEYAGHDFLTLSLAGYAEDNEVALKKFGEDFLLYVEKEDFEVDSVSISTHSNSTWVQKGHIGVTVFYKKDNTDSKLTIDLGLEYPDSLSALTVQNYKKSKAVA